MEGKEGWLDSFAKWKVGRLDSFAKRKVARAERQIGRFAKTKGNSADLIKKTSNSLLLSKKFLSSNSTVCITQLSQTPQCASHRRVKIYCSIGEKYE